MTLSVSEVAHAHATSPNNVRNRVQRGSWAKFVVPGATPMQFREMPPAYKSRPSKFQAQHVPETEGIPPGLSSTVEIGQSGGRLLMAVNAVKTRTKLDAALEWAAKGMCVMPVEDFLGVPLLPNWYKVATADPPTIVEWWSQWPDADIAAVPDKSGHFVIVLVPSEGSGDPEGLEEQFGKIDPVHVIINRYGNAHLWFRGTARTSHHIIGQGIHVLGRGNFVFLPPSYASDPSWKER